MPRIACLLFVKLAHGSGITKVFDAARSQYGSQRILLGTVPTDTFGTQVDTEYDEDIKEKREVSKVDADGLTLGITVGTQPMSLRRFGTQSIVMTELPLNSFGTQLKVPSEVPSEERLADGFQRWGSQVPEPSMVPLETATVNHKSPEEQPVTMSEAMVPRSEVVVEKPKQQSIVLSAAPLHHSWRDDIIVSKEPLKHFGTGTAVVEPKPSQEWHLAWEASVSDTTRSPQLATAGRSKRFKSPGAQQQIAIEAEVPSGHPPIERTATSFERILDLWREAFFVMCIVCLAIQMCCRQQNSPKPLLRA